MSLAAISIVFICQGCDECLVASTSSLNFEDRVMRDWFIGFDQDFCGKCRYQVPNQAAIAHQERQLDNLRTRLIARIRAAIPQLSTVSCQLSVAPEVKHAA